MIYVYFIRGSYADLYKTPIDILQFALSWVIKYYKYVVEEVFIKIFWIIEYLPYPKIQWFLRFLPLI